MFNLHKKINIIESGCISYQEGLQLQESLHSKIVTEKGEPAILLMEHFPVITLGKNSTENNMLSDRKSLAKQGIEVVRVDRGGEATAHTLGQLVVYPILPIYEMKIGLRKFVYLLEEAVILVLKNFGVKAERDRQYPGVWFQEKKICAIGIRVKNKVSMHGIALNVNADLSIFSNIVPCGIEGRGVINLNSIVLDGVDISYVAKVLIEKLESLFEFTTFRV